MKAIARPPAAHPRWKRLVFLVAFAVAVALPRASAGVAAEQPVSEHGVKAAFLYQFTNYVQWPVEAFSRRDEPFTIAVIGADPVAAELALVVAGRRVGGRPLAVRRASVGESLAGVHLVFVGRRETPRLGQLVHAYPRNILTVTESEGALDHGSMINFVVTERRVRFEVALDSAEKSGLRMSSRLLAVAQHVRTGTQ